MKNRNKELMFFGGIWVFIFALIALLPLLSAGDVRSWALWISVIILGVVVLRPSLLEPLLRIWLKIGNAIGFVMSKLILAILFFIVFTPVSLLIKVLRKDLLNKRIEKERASYWEDRKTRPQSMKYQF